ncbi:MAG TPA: energy transducer TonB [Bacteroidales bacterium]|nr:energy transducer TonB [Bacteroidales bacterium]HRZ49843.1 energy transducer TonB [Bacteroidales bacterium]
MESKKNPRFDLQKKQPVFIQIGLILSLSTVLLAFEYKNADKVPLMLPIADGPSTLLTELIPVTQQTPPKSSLPAVIRVLTTIDITDDSITDFPDPDWPDPTKPIELPPYRDPRQKVDTGHIEKLVPPLNMEVLAQFPGGDAALFAWLGTNLSYPEIAKRAGIEGTVFVRFIVAVDGTISGIMIERGNLGGGCEEAAMAAVAKMPKWIPARQRNRPAESSFILPIRFELVH